MKKFDISTSKIILIILGVLVAIVIGFNSKAVGAESTSSMMKFSSGYTFNIDHDGFISDSAHKVIKSVRTAILD